MKLATIQTVRIKNPKMIPISTYKGFTSQIPTD